MWPPKRPSLEGMLPHCQAVTTNRKDLKLSFTEGRNPFWLLWGKEQQLGYLQQRCTPWFLRAPRLENLRWSDGKVATFHMAFVCHVLFCQHLHATRLWRGSGCGTFHRTPMSSQLNSEWLTDRERFWLPGTRSRLLSGKPDEWMVHGCHPFIPVCTGSGSGMQNPLVNIHWRFLLKSEMIGLPSKSPMSSRHNVSIPSIRERGSRTYQHYQRYQHFSKMFVCVQQNK